MGPSIGSSGPVCCFDRNDAVKDSFKILETSVCIHYHSCLREGWDLLTRVTVARFRVSPLDRTCFVGHSNDSARPSGLLVMVYTSSAYSVLLPSMGSHMPSRNFMMSSCTDRCKCFCFNTQTDKGSLHRRNRKQPKQHKYPLDLLTPQRASLASLLTRVHLKRTYQLGEALLYLREQ